MFQSSSLIRNIRVVRCSSLIPSSHQCTFQLPIGIFSYNSTTFSSDSNKHVKNQETSTRVSIDTNISTGVCRVELDRPNKLNAFDLAMFEAVAETAFDLKQDRSIRTIILSGRGRAFSTGLDIKAILKDGAPMQTIERLLERQSRQSTVLQDETEEDDEDCTDINSINSNLAQDVSILWRELDVPVIAVLEGMCYGAGLQVALGADFRYSTPDCQFSIMEGKWGLIPDMGASIFLRELVRIDVAKELTMTGRIFNGREAAELGIVTRVCDDPMKDAKLFAEKLAKKSPDAVAASKRLFHATWTQHSNDKSLLLETRLQKKLLASWNQLAASTRSTVGWNIPYMERK